MTQTQNGSLMTKTDAREDSNGRQGQMTKTEMEEENE